MSGIIERLRGENIKSPEITLIAEMQETSGYILEWENYLLAKYPDQEQKVQDQIQHVKDELINLKNEHHATQDADTLAYVFHDLRHRAYEAFEEFDAILAKGEPEIVPQEEQAEEAPIEMPQAEVLEVEPEPEAEEIESPRLEISDPDASMPVEFTLNINVAENFFDLYPVLYKQKHIVGTRGIYSANEIVKLIEAYRNGDFDALRSIPRTGGLREKVDELKARETARGKKDVYEPSNQEYINLNEDQTTAGWNGLWKKFKKNFNW